MPSRPGLTGDTEQLTEPMSPNNLIKTTKGMILYRQWCLNEIDILNRNPLRRTSLITDKKGRICIIERLLAGKYRWRLAEKKWRKENSIYETTD